jgi:hypothetical protein
LRNQDEFLSIHPVGGYAGNGTGDEKWQRAEAVQ